MIVEDLYGETVFSRDPMAQGIVRMSLVEGCPRREGYTTLGYPVDTPAFTPRRRAAADDGTLHERDLVDRLLTRGFKIWNYAEDQAVVYLRSDSNRFMGHPDLFMERDNVIRGLEIKGYRDEVFNKYVSGATEVDDGIFIITDLEKLRTRPFPLMGQIQMYLNSETSVNYGVEEWVLLMKNKNTAALAECVVPKDPEYLQNLIHKWRGFWGYMRGQTLPDRFFSSDSMECDYCPYFITCWNKLKKVKDETVEVPSLFKAAEWRRRGMEYKRQSEALLQGARLEFEKQHLIHEVNRITCDGMSTKLTERDRHGFSTEMVEGMFARLVKEGKVTKKEVDEARTVSDWVELRFTDRRKD